jgi:hypothetical protein
MAWQQLPSQVCITLTTTILSVVFFFFSSFMFYFGTESHGWDDPCGWWRDFLRVQISCSPLSLIWRFLYLVILRRFWVVV